MPLNKFLYGKITRATKLAFAFHKNYENTQKLAVSRPTDAKDNQRPKHAVGVESEE